MTSVPRRSTHELVPQASRRSLLVVGVAASVIGGALVAALSGQGLGLVIALFAVVFVLSFPLYGLMGIFFVVNALFVIDRTQRIGFTIPGVGGTISATDLLYAIMMVHVAWNWALERNYRFPKNDLNTPLVLLLVWSMFCLAVGLLSGNEVKKTLIESRALLYLTVFFLTVFLVRNEKTVVWVVKAFYAAYFVTLALGLSIFVQGRKTIEYFTAGQMDLGQSIFPRFTFVSSDWVLSLLFITLGLIIFLGDPKKRRLLSIVSCLLLFNLFIIQARTQAVALFVGLIPIFILAPTEQRLKFIASGAAGFMIFAVLLFAVAQTEAGSRKLVDPILERFSGIYKGQTEVDQSLERREFELKAVWPGIQKRPLIGNGFGSKWSRDPVWETVFKYDATYIHSSWLFYLFKMGVVGSILLALLFYRTGRIALRIVRNRRIPAFRGIALGILATMPTFAFTGLLQPTLWHFQMTPTLGFEFALVVIMDRILAHPDVMKGIDAAAGGGVPSS